MPTGITVPDLIKSSMRLIGAIATGETPTADELNDGLLALNDILENWTTERLSVWNSRNIVFPIVANKGTYTIGPGGDFATDRPVDINGAYCTVNGVDFPVRIIGQDTYNSISTKAQTQGIVEQLLYVNEFPLGLITLWPVPSAASTLTLSTNGVLVFPVTASATLVGPPGFLKALRYNLAVDLAPEFGVDASPTVMAISADAKGDFKRTNLPVIEAMYDAALSSDSVASWQRGY